MNKYHIFSIFGCDDTTEFIIECSEDEYEFMLRLSRESKEVSTYGCMPTIEVDSEYASEELRITCEAYNRVRD